MKLITFTDKDAYDLLDKLKLESFLDTDVHLFFEEDFHLLEEKLKKRLPEFMKHYKLQLHHQFHKIVRYWLKEMGAF